MGCGGSSPKVQQAETLTPEQKQMVAAISNVTIPGMTGPDFGPFYPGQRLAPIDDFYTQAGRSAVGNLTGNLDQVFSPIMNQFQNRIAPEVMNQFSALGSGGAASGGAMAALSRAGADLTASLAPYWLQAQTALPGIAQQAGSFQQMAQQQPLDIEQQKWLESMGLAGPYLDLARSVLPSSGQFAENIASPGQQSFLSSLGGGMAGGLGMAFGLGLSDSRHKENIEKIDDALEKLEAIEGVTFAYKNQEPRHGGVIAQQVEEVFPEAVKHDASGSKWVDYHALIGLLIEAVKTLKRHTVPTL